MRHEEIRRNKEWDKIPEEKKELILASLPLPIEIIVAIFAAITFLPLLISLIFKGINPIYSKLIQIAVVAIFGLWVIFKLFSNYKKKTGKLLNKDLKE